MMITFCYVHRLQTNFIDKKWECIRIDYELYVRLFFTGSSVPLPSSGMDIIIS